MKTTQLFLILFSVLLFGCVSDNNVQVAPTSSNIISNSSESNLSSVPIKLQLKIGESAEVINSQDANDRLEIQVTSVLASRYYSYASRYSGRSAEFAAPGKIFYIVDIEFRNVGTTNQFIFANDFALIDQYGTKYNTESYYGEEAITSDQLYANTRKSGKVIFSLPESARGIKLVYEFSGPFERATKLVEWKFDEEAVRQFIENRSVSFTIDSVDSTWRQYSSFGSGSIGEIEYTLDNNGNVAVEPIFNLEIWHNNVLVKNETIDRSLTLIEEESKRDSVYSYLLINESGPYRVVIKINDKQSGISLANAEKDLFLG